MAKASKELENQDEAKGRAAVLEKIRCIHYPLRFRKDSADVEALLDSGSEVNAMTPAFASRLALRTRHTNIRAQKIDGSTLQTLGMVLASFQVEDKFSRIRFFQESFLLADITAEVVLGMPF